MRISIRIWGLACLVLAFVMMAPGGLLSDGSALLAPQHAISKNPGLGVAPPDLAPLASSLPEFPSNLTHFVYIVRENHVFDDYLGDCALDINDTCDDGQGWTSPACSSPPCLSDPKSETSASGDQLLTPYLHDLAREYSVFDNYYSSVDPYSAQAHAYFFSATVDGGSDTGGTCPTTIEGTGSGTEWGDYNTTDVQQGDCGFSSDSGSQNYPSSGTIFDRFTSSHESPTSSTTPPFLTIGDILWELNSPGCTHDSFGSIAGGLPGNSEAIDYVTCSTGNGWWTNTTNGQITTPPVINPTTHTPQMLDVCQYACDDIPTYPDEYAANDFVSYVKDYGLPTYTFIELFDDHPSSGSTTNCGAATQSDCIQYNDESMDRIVGAVMNGSSQYRNNTLIAIQEDDTQDGENGADHVNNGRRIPLVIVAPPNVMKTGNPSTASCGVSASEGECGNVVHETYNTSNILAAMERVEMNVYPSVYSASITSTTFPMVQNDELAMVNPLEALWRCSDPRVSPYCNTGVGGGNYLTSTSVSPNPVAVAPSGTQAMTATAYDNGTSFSGPTYAWSLYPSSLGSLSPTTGSSVTFTAGSATGHGNICVNATYKTYQTAMGCTIVTVTSTLALASVAVTPSTVAISAGSTSSPITGAATTTASTSIYPSTSGSTWTWTLSSSSAGALNVTSGNVVDFVAGSGWGNTTACLNVTWSSVTKMGCTWISVSKAPPQLASVTVTPAGPITVGTSSATLFTATAYNQYGAVMTGSPLGFSFSLSPTTLGTVAPASSGPWADYTNFTAASSATKGNLTVTVTDGVNIPHSATVYITVSATPPLTATATASPTTGAAPLTVSFSGTVSGGSGTYSDTWNFGDGTSTVTQTGASPSTSHEYTTCGSTFSPTLTISDGTSTYTASAGTITTNSCSTTQPLIAHASATPLTGGAPLSVQFSGSSTGGGGTISYAWTFGDGSTAVTGNPSPSHTYANPGLYVATFWVNDTDGQTSTAQLGVDATSSSSSGLHVAATCSPVSGPEPLVINCAATAAGGTPSYTFSWSFGDSSSPATGASVSHTYSSTGTFPLVVTATDAASDTAKAFLNVTVGAALSVSASASVTSGTAPLSVSFTAVAGGGVGPYTYAWNFGDNSAAGSGSSISHTFENGGQYTVTVTATDAEGHTATYTLAINVGAPTTPSGGTGPFGLSWLDFGLILVAVVLAVALVAALVTRKRHHPGGGSELTPYDTGSYQPAPMSGPGPAAPGPGAPPPSYHPPDPVGGRDGPPSLQGPWVFPAVREHFSAPNRPARHLL